MLTKKQIKALIAEAEETYEAYLDVVIKLWEGNAHEAYGQSWKVFATDCLPHYKMVPEERRRVVVRLRNLPKVMSTRNIAAVLGVTFKTVARDLETSGVSNDTDEHEESEGETKPKKAASSKRSAGGEPWRQEVEAFKALQAEPEHSDWTNTNFCSYLGLKSIEVQRLMAYAAGPPELVEMVYRNELSRNTGEMLLRGTSNSNDALADSTRIVLARKIAAGLAPRAAAEVIKMMQATASVEHGNAALRNRWLSPEEAMTWDQFRAALENIKAGHTAAAKRANKKNREFKAQWNEMFGVGIMQWLGELDSQTRFFIKRVEGYSELPMNAGQISRTLREASERLWDAADLIDEKQQPEPESEPETLVIQG